MIAIQKTSTAERVRGPVLATFVRSSNGVAFDEGLSRANEGNHLIASNARLGKALDDEMNEWRRILDVFACWSGTMTGHLLPGVPFDEKSLVLIKDDELERRAGSRYFIEHVDSRTKISHLLPVHPDYFGVSDGILVTEHPNYVNVRDDNRILTLPVGMSLRAAVDLVTGFPPVDGRYTGDSKHDIPVIGQTGPERYLVRTGKRVGPVARCCTTLTLYTGVRKSIYLNFEPSDLLGMAVEAPLGSAQQEMAPHPFDRDGGWRMILTILIHPIQSGLFHHRRD